MSKQSTLFVNDMGDGFMVRPCDDNAWCVVVEVVREVMRVDNQGHELSSEKLHLSADIIDDLIEALQDAKQEEESEDE